MREMSMNAKWLSIVILVAAASMLLGLNSCAHSQQLVSIEIQPGSETVGASNVPVIQDTGFQVQLQALGTYIHPPVTKDITSQVTWASNTPQMFSVNPAGLLTATGNECGATLVSATADTNNSSGGISSSGAVVTGYMTANVVCFSGTGPTVTVDFAGAGTGTISSSPSGLGCFATSGTSCSGSFPTGSSVTLTVDPNGTFGGWAGCTINSGTTCTLQDLTSDVTVTATFN
jgi:hypothetical protein